MLCLCVCDYKITFVCQAKAGGLDKNAESFGVRVKGFWDLPKTKWVGGVLLDRDGVSYPSFGDLGRVCAIPGSWNRWSYLPTGN